MSERKFFLWWYMTNSYYSESESDDYFVKPDKARKQSPSIIKHNYTRYAKGLEIFMYSTKELSARDYKVLIAIIHLTYGFNNDETTAKPAKIAAMTNLRKNHVSECLTKLHKLGVIFRERNSITMLPKMEENKDGDDPLLESDEEAAQIEIYEPPLSEEEMMKRLWPDLPKA